MIGLYEFNELDINSKADLIWKDGKFIENYADETCRVNLYFLYNFYVEVYYSVQANSISEILAFKKGQRLEKYVNRVEIENLFNDK